MAAFLPSFLSGTELAYPKTEVGVTEVKELPAGKILVARSPRPYFSGGNPLFGRLFRYIQSNRIPMTAPVEAAMEPGTMVFYVDAASSTRGDLASTRDVELREVPARTVASVGIRGSYTQASYDANLARLREWLASRPDLEVAGEPYAVYWDSPFVPGFLKRSEVHIPVRKRAG
jgi:effector-binding domain-containing protein